MAGELKERLLSDKKGVQLEKEVKRSKIDTPAEGGLRDIVAHKVGGDGSGGSGAGMINNASVTSNIFHNDQISPFQ